MSVVTQAPAPNLRRLVEHLRTRQTDQFENSLAVPAGAFSDPEVARAERELVFSRVPVAVAHASELPAPGSFITTRQPNNEVLVVRSEDGVRAFVNACRHRGALLEGRESGSCHRFQCPYHGWSYNLDGSLRSVTHEVSFGEFDRIASGLVELPAEERHGFVWVIDSPEADTIDVAAWLGPEIDAILATYDLERYVCAKQGGFDEPINWKLLQDAFLDGYHIQFVHQKTAARTIYTNIMAIDDYGRHSRFMTPRRSIEPFLEVPESELTDANLRPHVTLTHGLLPNATLLLLPDHVELLSFVPHPTDPGASRMEMRMLVPSIEDSGLEEARWHRLWDKNWEILMMVLRDEDFPILRDTQRALSSRGAGGTVLGRNEVANQVFHRELHRLLAAPDAA